MHVHASLGMHPLRCEFLSSNNSTEFLECIASTESPAGGKRIEVGFSADELMMSPRDKEKLNTILITFQNFFERKLCRTLSKDEVSTNGHGLLYLLDIGIVGSVLGTVFYDESSGKSCHSLNQVNLECDLLLA